MKQLPPLDVLYEDNHCLVVNKPSRVLAVGDETGEPTLLDQAKAYLKQKYNKPGDVWLGVVHRLDRPTSGVLLFARTSKAAGRLSASLREHTWKKTYHAVVEGRPPRREALLTCCLRQDDHENQVRIVDPDTPGAKYAELTYRILRELPHNRTLLEVVPKTGRKHQIRAMLAAEGTPIVGDSKYGATSKLGGKIALHAARLEFPHPTKKTTVRVEAPDPEHFGEL